MTSAHSSYSCTVTAIVNADGSPPTQPTQQALMQYNQDLSYYYKNIKGYIRLKNEVEQVEAHITKTMSLHWAECAQNLPKLV